MTTEQKKEFIKKFKSLLTEYNVGIAFDCDPCSDIGAIYDAAIEVYERWTDKPIIRAEGWSMISGDVSEL